MPAVPTLEYLTHATKEEYTELVARHWDDLDWADLWQLHILAAVHDPDRRQHLHYTAKANPHPTLDATLYRCHLTRLQWAGLSTQRRCPLEKEIVTWAITELQEWDNSGFPEKICHIFAHWQREPDEYLCSVLRSILKQSEKSIAHPAVLPVLIAHPGEIPATISAILVALLAPIRLQIPGSTESTLAAQKALLTLATRNPVARQTLIDRYLLGHSKTIERPFIIQCLAHFLHETPELLQAFVQRISSPSISKPEYAELVKALIPFANSIPDLLPTFQQRWDDGKLSKDERRSIAKILGIAAKTHPDIYQYLIDRWKVATSNTEGLVALIKAFTQLADHDPSIRQRLIERMQTQAITHYERLLIEKALIPSILTDPAVMKALLTRIHTGAGTDEARTYLLKRFTDSVQQSDDIRIILTLRMESGKSGPLECKAIPDLLALVINHDLKVKKSMIERYFKGTCKIEERFHIAQAIINLPDLDAATLGLLLDCINRMNHCEPRLPAFIDRLIHLESHHPEIKDAFLARYEVANDNNKFRIHLTQALGHFAIRDKKIADRLKVRFLSGSGLLEERTQLILELTKLEFSETELKKLLITRFKDDTTPGAEKEALTKALTPLALRDIGLQNTLIEYLKQHPEHHYSTASTHYWQILHLDRIAQHTNPPQSP